MQVKLADFGLSRLCKYPLAASTPEVLLFNLRSLPFFTEHPKCSFP
jgi:hypothetical protein